MTHPDPVKLAEELERLHNEARGCEFDLVPADGPIARLALFMHENGDAVATALRNTSQVRNEARTPPRQDQVERVEQAAREAIARMKERDSALSSAACVRNGDWDDASEVRYALVGARAAITALGEASTQSTLYKEAWDDLRRYIYDRTPERREKSITRFQQKIAALSTSPQAEDEQS